MTNFICRLPNRRLSKTNEAQLMIVQGERKRKTRLSFSEARVMI
jgi:hypothetical protein